MGEGRSKTHRIQQDHLGRLLRDALEGRASIRRIDHAPSLLDERSPNDLARGLIVIDNQHVRRRSSDTVFLYGAGEAIAVTALEKASVRVEAIVAALEKSGVQA